MPSVGLEAVAGLTILRMNRGGLRYVLAVENRQWQQVQNYQNYPVPPPGVCNNPSPVSLKREHTGESLENFIGPKRPRLLPADGNQDASTSLGPGENIQTPFDGAILPWPVPVSAWNDRDQLRSIIEDFRSFTRVIEARLADLEEPMATTTFWEEQAAKILGDYPSADDYWV
ncbi:hypothetical protein P175DRAFT_0492703 [Aspergillus ochraceoroseus IBT 24754]|uniref:Uncharacterized protein n=1 Tax=Aspergillus ochraceoroseus IBT 24754 TaxID=1392256 RepID=A0A2T5M0P8_9EURO|nr:uncharacterized protein P175DRAFT_0492703 [Aspergillus ochraceoroseus IBT 24754]PTU22100.1 hypothetical protein P175DRAFT_0492703 [Aspergillus ochraceoroseus IBT 24754]